MVTVNSNVRWQSFRKKMSMTQMLQKFIIDDLNVKTVITPAVEYRNRVEVMKTFLQSKNLTGYVLHVEETQNSILTAHIAHTAVKELRESTGNPAYRNLSLILPYAATSIPNILTSLIQHFIQADETIAHDIQETVTAMEKKFNHSPDMDAADREQMTTRVRTTVQHSYAQTRNLGVAGSGSSAQHITGHETRHGDTICHILPLSGLSRYQVNQMLHHLNAPEYLLTNIPTTNTIGINYTDIDQYLSGETINPTNARELENHYFATETQRRKPIANYDTLFQHHKRTHDQRTLSYM